jgi:hypothetical protein
MTWVCPSIKKRFFINFCGSGCNLELALRKFEADDIKGVKTKQLINPISTNLLLVIFAQEVIRISGALFTSSFKFSIIPDFS